VLTSARRASLSASGSTSALEGISRSCADSVAGAIIRTMVLRSGESRGVTPIGSASPHTRSDQTKSNSLITFIIGGRQKNQLRKSHGRPIRKKKVSSLSMLMQLLLSFVCLLLLLTPASPIATSLVVPSTHAVHDFECAICNNLVEEPVYTTCTHVFCGACLEEWLVASRERTGEEPRCPKCQAGLGGSDSRAPLRAANPLAWRILSRVQCRCPLSAGARPCEWIGDFSEVHAHALQCEAGDGATGGEARAGALKAQGNAKFEARAFREAEELYSKALAAHPDASLFANRAAARLLLDQLDGAVADCRAALSLQPDHPR